MGANLLLGGRFGGIFLLSIKRALRVVFYFPFHAAAIPFTAVFRCYWFGFLTLHTPSPLPFFVVRAVVYVLCVTAARIQQSTSVKRKDIRKFLDGIYVSEKLNIVADEEE